MRASSHANDHGSGGTRSVAAVSGEIAKFYRQRDRGALRFINTAPINEWLTSLRSLQKRKCRRICARAISSGKGQLSATDATRETPVAGIIHLHYTITALDDDDRHFSRNGNQSYPLLKIESKPADCNSNHINFY
jgi:hypothetical protein